MKLYKLTIEPRSPFITPLHSDTLFGHLAWAIIYRDGQAKLKAMLAEFNSEMPPFIISQAFPEGLLPLPVLPPLTQRDLQVLAGDLYHDTSTSTMVKLTARLKEIKSVSHITIETFRNLAQNLSPVTLAKALLETPQPPNGTADKKEVIMHTAVDRITGSAREDALFDHEQTFFPPQTRLTIWLKLRNDSWKDDLLGWFKVVEADGFGKRKSTGLGQFSIVGDMLPADGELPQVANPNAFMCLSSYVPRGSDPHPVSYRYLIKRGKLGGYLALGDRVWKKPLLMFAPGSVFCLNGELRHFYGGLVPRVHHYYSEIVHYAFALPLGISLHYKAEDLR